MPTKKSRGQSYRQMSDELASIVDWFESGNIDIDTAVVKYQQAIELINQLEKYIKTAEIKVKKISASIDK